MGEGASPPPFVKARMMGETTPPADKWQRAKVVVAALIGSTIEWYDFMLYGVLSYHIFEKDFFPVQSNPTVASQMIHIGYVLGFVTRPLGGVFFGHFGDRIGRRKMFVITLMLMGLSTFALGLVPTYKTIGIWSPLLVVILRCIQGFALGGEWGAAVLMCYEYAPPGRRGVYASLPQAGLALGVAMSTGTLLLIRHLPTGSFQSYGWRIAFLLSGVLAAIGYYVRSQIRDTPQFRQIQQEGSIVKYPLWTAIKQRPRNIIFGLGALWSDGLLFAVIAVWGPGYLSKEVGIPRDHALGALVVAGLCLSITTPLIGAATDKLGRVTVFITGNLLSGATGFFAFHMYDLAASSNKIWLVYLTTTICLAVIFPCMSGPFPAMFADLFDTNVRYSALSFILQLSRVYGTGLAPRICTDLYHKDHDSPKPIMKYMMTIGLLSALCVAFLKHRPEPQDETHQTLTAAAMRLSRGTNFTRRTPRGGNNMDESKAVEMMDVASPVHRNGNPSPQRRHYHSSKKKGGEARDVELGGVRR